MTHILLIADDSPAKAALLQAFLHRSGWVPAVHTAATTEDAARIIQTEGVTHALVDYYMPTENGPAVIARLRAKNSDARIALVSSLDNADNRDEAMKAGAEAFVCTSWPADEVESALLGLLEEWKGV